MTLTIPITRGPGREARALAHLVPEWISAIASARVAGLVSIEPRTAEVIVRAPALRDPAHGHAEVLGLDHHDHAARLEDLHERVGDLGGQPLLHLRALGVDVDEPGQLGQPGDLAGLGRDVADVGHPGERHEVVLAHRPQLDVADQHHLVVADVEGGGEHVVGRLAQALGQLGVRPRDPRRRLAQALALGVLAHRARAARGPPPRRARGRSRGRPRARARAR